VARPETSGLDHGYDTSSGQVSFKAIAPEGFHTVAMAAKALNVSRQRVHQLLNQRGIKATAYGAFLIISEDDLSAISHKLSGGRPKKVA
jgi:hypothetical protein